MKGLKTLNNIFDRDLNVLSIAEKFKVCNMEDYKIYSEKKGFDSVIIIDNGEYKIYDNWKDEDISRLRHEDVISESTPLLQTFQKLLDKRRLIVKTVDGLSHIVTKSDLDKIPFRIWLFGNVSLFELELREFIESHIPLWKSYLKDSRLKKAQELYHKKITKNEDIGLINCLQLCDFGTIMNKGGKQFLKRISTTSNNEFKRAFKEVNEIRDEVAHSNESFSMSWEAIFESVQFAESMIKDIHEAERGE